MSEKIEQTHELYDDHVSWLEDAVSKYDLADTGKALRILLSYCIQEADKDKIFAEIRCRNC